MKRLRIWAAIAGLVAVAACGSEQNDRNDTTSEDDRADDSSEEVRAEGLDVCGLVSEETLDPLREKYDPPREPGEPTEQTLREAHTFVGCQIGGLIDPNIAWGVRDPEALTNPPVEALLDDYAEGGEITEIEIDGVPARLAQGVHPRRNTEPDRFRLAMELDGLEVLVDGNNFQSDEGHDLDAARDLVLAVASEIVAGMDGTAPTRVDLHDFCPAAEDPLIVEAMEGDVVVALSVDHEPDHGSSWRCEYVNEYSVLEVRRSERGPDGSDHLPTPPSRVQNVDEVRGYEAYLGGRLEGEFTADGVCTYFARLNAVGPYDRWTQLEVFPSEEGLSRDARDDLREARVVAALEATYDATPC